MATAARNTEITPTALKPARLKHPAYLLPEAMQALQSLGGAVAKSGLSPRLVELISLRASQINGCSVCVDMHTRYMKEAGETDERLMTVAAWRDAPYFTDAERAAMALTEAVTRLSDREDPVSDAVWNDAARHYDEAALGALLVAMVTINAWNRLNVATRQVAFGKLPSSVAVGA
jgi:AhpD family alkylhydroperoxidase